MSDDSHYYVCGTKNYGVDSLQVECHKCHKQLWMDSKNALLVEQGGFLISCIECALAEVEKKGGEWGGAMIGGHLYMDLKEALQAAVRRIKESKEEKLQ